MKLDSAKDELYSEEEKKNRIFIGILSTINLIYIVLIAADMYFTAVHYHTYQEIWLGYGL
eukprot:Pgem_evm1s4977